MALKKLPHPCLVRGCYTLVTGSASRCPIHTPVRKDTRPPRPQYQGRWKSISKRKVAEWIARHGNICPGYEREAHEATKDNPLTLDHIKPVAAGGTAADENTLVLCRQCNSRKSNR